MRAFTLDGFDSVPRLRDGKQVRSPGLDRPGPSLAKPAQWLRPEFASYRSQLRDLENR